MCMFDVRTSRKKVGNVLFTGMVVNGAPREIPRNPNRTAIVLTFLAGSDPAVDQGEINVFATDLSGAHVGQLNIANPSVIMRLEDWGQVVTGPLSVATTTAGTQVVTVVEIAYLEELEKL